MSRTQTATYLVIGLCLWCALLSADQSQGTARLRELLEPETELALPGVGVQDDEESVGFRWFPKKWFPWGGAQQSVRSEPPSEIQAPEEPEPTPPERQELELPTYQGDRFTAPSAPAGQEWPQQERLQLEPPPASPRAYKRQLQQALPEPEEVPELQESSMGTLMEGGWTIQISDRSPSRKRKRSRRRSSSDSSQWHWQSHITGVGRAGDFREGGGVIGFLPLWQNPCQLFFTQGRVYRMRRQTTAGIGLGYRRLLGRGIAGGVNGFVDYGSIVHGNGRWQISGGLELFSNCWHTRLNGYLPQKRPRRIVCDTFNKASIVGQEIRVQTFDLCEVEQGYRGFDAEAGYCFGSRPCGELWGYAGYFHYSADSVRDMNGPRLRVEYRIEEIRSLCQARITLGAEWQHDRVRKTEAGFYASIRWPLGYCRPAGCCPKCSLYRRMGDSVFREVGITTAREHIGAELVQTVTELERLFFVWNTPLNPGAGTQSSPTNIRDALTRAGPDDILVFLQDYSDLQISNIAAESITAEPGQQYLGYGENKRLPITLSDGTKLVVKPLPGRVGTRAVLDGVGGNTLLQLADRVRVQGIALDGGLDGIIGSDVKGVVVEDILLQNNAGDGIEISGSSSIVVRSSAIQGAGVFGVSLKGQVTATLVGNRVSAGSDGIYISADPDKPLETTVTHNAITGGANGFHVDVSGNGGYHLGFSQNIVTGLAGAGGLFNNTTSDCANLTITAFESNAVVAPSGGFIVNRATFDATPNTSSFKQVSGGATVLGTLSDRLTGDGLRLNGVCGDLHYAALQIANNGGTGLFIRDGDGKGGTYHFGNSSGSVNTHNGAALDLDPVTLASTFASLDSTNSPTDGVLCHAVAGRLTAGTTRVDKPAGSGLHIRNSAARFDFITTLVSSPGIDGITLTSNDGTFDGHAATITNSAKNGLTTTFADGDVRFTSFNCDGAVNGMELIGDSTALGTLVVTGRDNTPGSGGILQHLTHDGIVASNVAGIELCQMNITAIGCGVNVMVGDSISGNMLLDHNVITGGASAGVAGVVSGSAELTASVTHNTLRSATAAGLNFQNTTGQIARCTVTDLTSNAVTEAGAGGMRFANVTFDATPLSPAVRQVQAGATVIGTPERRILGGGLQLSDVVGKLHFDSLAIATDAGTSLSVQGFAPSFELDVTDGSVDAQVGAAVVAGPAVLDLHVASVVSTGSPTDGISLDRVKGNLAVTGATTIVGPANNGIDCRGGSFTATFGETDVKGAGGDGVVLANPDGEFSVTGSSYHSLSGDGAKMIFGDGDVTFQTLNVQ